MATAKGSFGQLAHLPGDGQALELPAPTRYVMSGIRWGHFDRILTPAFWKVQCWLQDRLRRAPPDLRVGENLLEEVIACTLGGYGIPSEVGYAAYFSLLDNGLLTSTSSEDAIRAALSAPLRVRGRLVHYRFPRQRAMRIARILQIFSETKPPSEANVPQLLAWLEALPGVGPKTAAWIVRNRNPNGQLAVIDVHIFRAGCAIGLFSPHDHVDRDYSRLQERYLNFCARLDVSPIRLDAVMWRTMRDLGRYGIDLSRAMTSTIQPA
jgi:N-glycosylase/DNA lyase